MSTHTLAILVQALGAGKAAADLKGVDKAVSSIGGHAGRGIRTAAGNLAKLGVATAGVAAGLGAVAIKNGVESLATLENATTSVDGAIKQMGQTGQVTSGQVATWANEIESSVQAAFDDKDITAATAGLIRYGKVGPENLRRSMVVMTDLAAKTGDVGSAGSLLAKALADPTKAAGKLTRQGIILTKAEQAQIDKFMKAGKVGKAQTLVLQAIERQTKGAAAAAKGPYADALNELNDAGEDVTRALAVGFLPVIQKASQWLTEKLADPATLKTIRDIGDNLAGAADKALSFVEGIPWDKVVSGLQAAAGFAKGLIDAFTSMPPEVQGTIIALAGLNKLSGGAISGIVGELGKGLIKGVLGMTAGVVNINAGVVNGGGGAGDLLTKAAPAAAGAGLGATVFVAGMSAAVFAGLGVALVSSMQQKPNVAKDSSGATKPGQVFSLSHGFGPTDAKFRDDITHRGPEATGKSVGAYVAQKLGPTQKEIAAKQADNYRATLDGKVATQRAGDYISATTRSGTMGTTSAVDTARAAIVASLRSLPVPQVNVAVSPTTINNITKIQQRAGTVSGSRGGVPLGR